MQDDVEQPIPRIVMDSSTVAEDDQFAYFAAHAPGSRLEQRVPGPFHVRGDMWTLGGLQAAVVEVDPFVATRDQTLINLVDADYLQLVQVLDGVMIFTADGKATEVSAPGAYIRDYGQPSIVTSTRTRLLILYIAREFLEEVTGPIDAHGRLAPVAELDLLRDMAIGLIRFFPAATAGSASLYAAILRDLAATALLRAGASRRTEPGSLLAEAKTYVAAQPPGTLTVAAATAALGISRSALYRLFERDGGLLAYDRMRRLRAAHRAMSNPLNTSTLVELAARYGFRDQAALLRSFRKTFGYSPSDLRQRHVIVPSSMSESGAEEVWHALDSIG
jgi:AraC-like DNA-binding protein